MTHETKTTPHLDATKVHYVWGKTISPRLRVTSGTVVSVEMRSGNDDFYTRSSTVEEIGQRTGTGHALSGPIFVDGAHPGSILEVEILEVRTRDWGYTQVVPGRGLLPDDFDEPHLQIWDLSDGQVARSIPDVSIPIEPFLGVVGVAPAADGEHATRPPRITGGNLDIKHLTAGSRIWLPVEVEGALVSLGDPHAAQGDGEVCTNAIETGAWARLRLTVHNDRGLVTPQFQTAGPLTPRTNVGPWHATCGIGPDLMLATQEAIRAMIRYLQSSYDLKALEAYVLASVAVDVKISEVVNRPNYVVSAYLPLSIFDS